MAAALWSAALFGTARAAPAAEAFAAPPAFTDISISPSGRRIAKVVQRASLDVLQVWDAHDLGKGPTAEFEFGPARAPNWIEWKTDDRLLVSVAVPTDRYDQLIVESRLIAFDAALKKPVLLNKPPKQRSIEPLDQDDVVSFLPDDPDHVLVAIDWFEPVWPSLRKVNVHTGLSTTVRERKKGVGYWMTDDRGTPVLAFGDPSKGVAAVNLVSASGEITPVAPAEVREDTVFDALGFDGDPDRLVVRSDHEGGTAGLYIYSPAQQRFVQTVFKHQRYDVGGVAFSPDGGRLAAYGFVADSGMLHYVDKDEQALVDRLAAKAGAKSAWFVRRTRDGAHGVLAVYDGVRVTEMFLVDVGSETLKSLGRYQPSLDQAPLGKVFPIAYKARDGLEIPGYVTLPPGIETLEQARGLPFVVMPHGGPASRDSADFDWWAQFVATRGYGVLQPNFRGSTGYGEAFRSAGDREWGDAIQGDVGDGARWLVAQGLADPARMCMAGWSFGGYVAMMAAVENTDLFKCAASTAGVSDLPALYTDSYIFYGSQEVWRKLIGGGWGDSKRLIENSPVRRSREVAMPLLLVHGTLDDRVPVAHSRKMRDRLKRAGKPHEYLELELADHSLSREKDKLQFLKVLESFLSKHLGTEAPPR